MLWNENEMLRMSTNWKWNENRHLDSKRNNMKMNIKGKYDNIKN